MSARRASAQRRVAAHLALRLVRHPIGTAPEHPVPALPPRAAIVDHLRRQRLGVLLGERLLGVRSDVSPELRAAVARTREVLAPRAASQLLASEVLTSTLARAGVPAVVLKGPGLAERLHGDVAARESGDVDVLVPRPRLADAVAALAGVGYAERTEARGASELHLDLRHPHLPAVELHWRIHWYDDGFSGALLERAVAAPPAGPTADDELLALLVFDARDGLAGLRAVADVAAWVARHGAAAARHAVDTGVEHHPALRRTLLAAAARSSALLGVTLVPEVHARALERRVRMACAVSNWSLRGDRDQLKAELVLVDALLAPAGELGRWWRRWAYPPAGLIEERFGVRPRGRLGLAAWRGGHLAKLGVRLVWAAGLGGGRAARARRRIPVGRV